jgi:signal transduction histidine kinase
MTLIQQEQPFELSAGGFAYPGDVEFRRLLDKLPAGAYLCDAAGLITYYNQRAVELWGRAPRLHDAEDRFCGSFRLYSAAGAPIRHDQCWMALALQNNAGYNGEEIIVEQPGGQRLTVEAYANPIRDESNRLLGAVNVLVDVSHRKRYEQVLEQANEELERRVAERTAALEAANAALQAEIQERRLAEASARRFSQQALLAAEQERQRLSGELHDSTGQLTTALLINLGLLGARLNGAAPEERRELDAVRELAERIHGEIRSVSHRLRPPELEAIGLHEALKELCQELSRLVGEPIGYRGRPLPELDEATITAFYRVAQEALSNAIKHAGAGRIQVELGLDGDCLYLVVEDDGVGFDPPANGWGQKGIGLLTMRERLEILGGTLELTTAPGQGTRLRARSSPRSV